MRRYATFLIAFGAGVVLLSSVMVFRRHLPYTGMNLAPRLPPSVVMTIHDARIVGLHGGVKLWSTRARTIQLAQNRIVVTLDDITDGTVFDRGRPVLRVRAGRVAYNICAQDLQLSRGVTIEGARGQRISTEGAVWNSATGMLRSTRDVIFESPLGRMTAKLLTVDVRNREIRMWDVVGSANADLLREPAEKEARNAD